MMQGTAATNNIRNVCTRNPQGNSESVFSQIINLNSIQMLLQQYLRLFLSPVC